MNNILEEFLVNVMNQIEFRGASDWTLKTPGKIESYTTVLYDFNHIQYLNLIQSWMKDPAKAITYIQSDDNTRLGYNLAKQFLEKGII